MYISVFEELGIHNMCVACVENGSPQNPYFLPNDSPRARRDK